MRPAVAGSIALRHGEPVDALSLREFYLRPPNAQKNKKHDREPSTEDRRNHLVGCQ